jgi:hypothetical protein
MDRFHGLPESQESAQHGDGIQGLSWRHSQAGERSMAAGQIA